MPIPWFSPGGFGQKAFGTISDTAGVTVGFPFLGEMVELQRNLEVFANAGCHEISLPPNGRIQFPKVTGGATANWVIAGPRGAAAVLGLNPSTLRNRIKKLGISPSPR
jgi:hypothetical protein